MLFLIALTYNFAIESLANSRGDFGVSNNKDKKLSLQERFKELDYHADNVPDSYTKSIDQLVSYLIQPATNDIEKARVIFRWITQNIYYDDYGFNTGNYSDPTATGTFQNRRAVCEGYGDLFKAMGEKAGLEIVKISGYAKGYGHTQGKSFTETNHAWNAIKIDGKWRLFDATWGHGHGITENGKLKSIVQYTEFWFDTDPYKFIFTHLPEDKKWQLIDNPISKSQFEKLLYAHHTFFAVGFDGKTCFKEVLNGTIKEFPKIFSLKAEVKAISVPCNGILKKGDTVEFTFQSADVVAMAVISDGKWTHFQKDGDIFTLTLSPEKGELSISAKLSEDTNRYERVLTYTVK